MTVGQRSREDATMRINPPTLFWILIAAIVAADRFFSLVEFAGPWLPWCGAVIVIAGVGVSVAAKRQFQRIGTNVCTFEEPGKLVISGLFGISRNPMYLGLVVAGFGAALVSATLAALVLSAAFTLIVRYWYIAYEENAMLRRFDEPYRAYCRRVSRWFGRRRGEIESRG